MFVNLDSKANINYKIKAQPKFNFNLLSLLPQDIKQAKRIGALYEIVVSFRPLHVCWWLCYVKYEQTQTLS